MRTTMVDILEIATKKVITSVKINTDDKTLGQLEKLFTITEVETPLKATKDEIVKPITREITILFTDNAFFYEEEKAFDYVIGKETTSVGEELTGYMQEIRKNLTENLIANPKQTDYQSIYNTIKSQPILQPILDNKLIQDWAHFDETIYTEPSEDIVSDAESVLSRVEEHKLARENTHAVLRHHISEQKRRISLINMHTKLLQDNTKLIDDTNTQAWQELLKKYQLTNEKLQKLREKAAKYSVDINDIQQAIAIVSAKIASLEISNERLVDRKYHFERRKNAKNQKNILKNLPGGSTQGLMIIGELGRNMDAYQDQLLTIEEEIAQHEEMLQSLEKKLIDIFPPAQELFGLIQQEKRQLDNDEVLLKSYSDTTQKLHDTAIERKQAKDTLEFLYDEALFLRTIYTLDISNKTLSTCKKILSHPSLSQDDRAMYATLQKHIHTIVQQQSNRQPNQELIDATLSEISTLNNDLNRSHTERFVGHKMQYEDIAGHFAAIDGYTKQIHIQEQLISQERRANGLHKNESNDTISSYKEAISIYKKSIKAHDTDITSYIQQSQQDLAHATKKLTTQETTVTQRKVTIQSLQKRITDLLSNPNKLIIVRDLKKIQEKIDHHQSKLVGLQESVDLAAKNTSHAIDTWYHEILELSTIFARTQEHDAILQEMETILTNYLPKDGAKWDDLDRDIRGKRDDLHDSRVSLYALVQQIDTIVQDSVQTNKELRRNKPITTLQQSIKTFLLESDISL